MILGEKKSLFRTWNEICKFQALISMIWEPEKHPILNHTNQSSKSG
jgi:hypothetical protein